MAKIIAILNYKGGVGKTTTAVNLSDALHLLGKKVLLIDIDAQCNSTLILDGKGEVKNGGTTLYDAISPETLGNVEIYEHSNGFDFIAGDIRIANIDGVLANNTAIKELLLKRLINNVLKSEPYDYVIIDCAPNYGLMTKMALYAATSLIVPIDSQIMALDGLNGITNTYKQIKLTGMNDDLEIEGFLMTRFRANLTSAKLVYNTLKDTTHKVFNAKIRENTTVGSAPGSRQTIFEYDNTCAGAEDYMQLAKELIKKHKKA